MAKRTQSHFTVEAAEGLFYIPWNTLNRNQGNKQQATSIVWFTCNRVCTAWVTGKTPSVADKHSENPTKYPILRHPRMMVMTANNVILPKLGEGEG